MPINLRRCPFLVLKEIIQQMILKETFSLSRTSKKSLFLVRCCLSHQRFHIQHNVSDSNHSIEVIRNSAHTDDFETMKVVDYSLGEVYVYPKYMDTTQSMIEIYQCMTDLFPKAIIKLSFKKTSGDEITRIMKMAKVDEVEVEPHSDYEVTMTQAALDGCANTKKLRILNNSSFAELNPESRFEMDHLYIRDGEGWIYKKHIIQNFLNCKQVILPNTSFGLRRKDYPEFLEILMRGSKMELLKIGGRWIQKHRITDTVGVLPGAIEVRRARVWEESEKSEDRVFAAGSCYLVQQTGGTRAIVIWSHREFLLTTKFVVLKHAN